MKNQLHFPAYYFDTEAHVNVDVNPGVNIAEIGFWAGERLYFRFPMQESSLVYEMESPFKLSTCILENAVVTAVFPVDGENTGTVTLTATLKKKGEPDKMIDQVLAEWEPGH